MEGEGPIVGDEFGCERLRARVYGTYVSGRRTSIAPSALNGLQSRAAHLEKIIRNHFPADRNARIIDLGCGHGALIHFLRKAGYSNIEGVDRSPEQVAAASRLGIEGVKEGDLLSALAAMPDGRCDVVVTLDVIEHFHKGELLEFVDEVRRVLRQGGRWIVHGPNAESPFGARMRYGDFTHEMAFTRESISQLLLASGFTQVECYEEAPVAHGVGSAVRWLLWKGIRAGLMFYLAVETGAFDHGEIFTQNLLAVAVK
jgi:2-polyprenyl-3-methyl-5-hydroxy-6-metoxy-1,4-benzoquinol methylase